MSYAVYIGKNLTDNGIAYLAGYGDEPSSHWLELIPRQQHPENTMIEVGVGETAKMPGERIQIPQVTETARHLRTSYSYYLGVPAPITNGGLNEYGVAVRDVWSNSRDELIEMTPKDQKGINYSDMARILLERAKSAREAVEMIGSLIKEYGEATYGGNSHFVADVNEAWVIIEFAGGKGLWVAERVDDDSIRVSRPGYIENVDFESPNFLYSDNFISFAIEMGWYDPDKDKEFNANKIYGDGHGRWEGVRWIEEELKQIASERKVVLEDVFWALRTEVLTGDTAGYGQVVPLFGDIDPNMRYIWHTQTGSLAAPFTPVFLGINKVQEEFQNHRYLTHDEAYKFVDLRHNTDEKRPVLSTVSQGIESTRSAFAAYKRLMYLILQHYETYLPEVTEIWKAFEVKQAKLLDQSHEIADTLIKAGKSELASNFLTEYCNEQLRESLRLCETVSASLETRTRLLHGINNDMTPRSPKQKWLE